MAPRNPQPHDLMNMFEGYVERAVEDGEGGDHDCEREVEGVPNDELMGVV